MILNLLSILFPTFGVIGVGWIGRKTGVQGKGAAQGLSDYVYYIALPALIFQNIVTSNIDELFTLQDAQLLAGTVIAHLIIFLIAIAFSKTLATRIIPIIITFGSTAYLGIPFANYAFGKEGAVYASLLSVSLVTCLLITSILWLKRYSKLQLQNHVIKNLFELPLLWAVLAGLLWPILRLPPLPDFIKRLFETIGAGAGPVALLALGAYMYDFKFHDLPLVKASIISFLKVVLMPVVTFFILRWLGISGILLVIGVTMAATPTAITSFILSKEYKTGENLAAGTILLSMFFSLIVLSAIMYLWLGTRIFQ